jgi:hypothetical protein
VVRYGPAYAPFNNNSKYSQRTGPTHFSSGAGFTAGLQRHRGGNQHRDEWGALAEQLDLVLLDRPPVHTGFRLPVRVQLLAEGEVLAGHPPAAGDRRRPASADRSTYCYD